MQLLDSGTCPGSWAVRSNRVVTVSGIRPAVVVIEGERIQAVSEPDDEPPGMPTIDCGDRFLLPGLVDTHVHINEPGRTHWEGFETATRAAAAGGITTLLDMPLNSTPVTTTVDALRQKQAAAGGKLWVDVGFYGGIVPGNAEHILPLAEAGVFGFKAFLCHSGIDDFPNVTETDLRRALPHLAATGLPLLAHAELQRRTPMLPADLANDPRSYRRWLASRPPIWEHDAVCLLLELGREYKCPIHVVHVACQDVLPRCQQERHLGHPVTLETCPHYLFFAAESIPDGDTRFKCAPPIREGFHRDFLWAGLREGTIDTIGSDHSPAPPDLKALASGDLMQAWGGIASLQITLSAVWTEAARRGFSLASVVQWMATRPAAIMGLGPSKGEIAPGRDADLVVFDADATFTVSGAQLHHRHRLTPYEGHSLRGRVDTTYLRGRVVHHAGQVAPLPLGSLLVRNAAKG